MKITFLGGADEVGASSTLIEIGGKRLLVDAGIRPSPRARWGLAGDQLPDLSEIDARGGIDAILVTHAHTDHTGALELVTSRYPDIPVFATRPTATLTRILHQDSRRIMQSRLEEEGELPLFDDLAVQGLLSAFKPVDFHNRFPLGENLAVTFFPAGHIAGAAMIGLESDEGSLLLTGDLSISPQRTVDGCRPPAFRPDVLVVESTYGGRLHANRLAQERKLVEVVAAVTAGGGKVLVPAFALGRAQEILLIIAEFRRRGELPAVPVWADGMVRSICQAYTAFADFLPLALQEQNAQFFDESVRPVQTVEQRNALIWESGPAVIVSSSGMLSGGPSPVYARALARSPQHAILLTGYQDEESPGRRLQEIAEKGQGTLRLGKDKVDVQCRLGTYSLSAHADEGQLVSLVETLNPEQILLVHGDEVGRASLEASLSARKRIVHLPRSGQTYTFKFDRRRPAGLEAAVPARPAWNELVALAGKYYALDDLPGRWLVIRPPGGAAYAARCLQASPTLLTFQAGSGAPEQAGFEQVVAVLDQEPPDAVALSAFTAASTAPVRMEPNQALAFANQHFPAEARLRKAGYRLDHHVLTLTFDFPDAARKQYAGLISSLEAATGWAVEAAGAANQAALAALARELLPPGAQVLKGPAIHRDLRTVALSVALPGEAAQDQVAAMKDAFRSATGYELSLAIAGAAPAAPQPVILATTEDSAARWEMNAALAAIRRDLEGAGLNRASVKGDEIALSFISPQVGERRLDRIVALARQTGWRLSINPQPNQAAILEAARLAAARAGWTLLKGPSFFPERAEASLTLAALPSEDELETVNAAFEQETGYRLVVTTPAPAAPSQRKDSGEARVVQVPLNRIRLRGFHERLALDEVKLNRAIDRARRMGISPPIQVRRVSDGYLLDDGLYRLRAAIALGMETVPALVE